MKLGIMDSEKGLIDSKCEQNSAGQHDTVLVLSDIKESERVRRVCRTLKYQPKLVQRSGAEKVCDFTADLIVKGAEDASNEQHVCRICGTVSTCRAELEAHLKDHKVCKTGYGLRSGLEKNYSEEREEQSSSDEMDPIPESPNHDTQFQQSKNICNLCGIEYVYKSKLVVHMRIHTGETPYKCKECGKGFRRSDWLAKHVKMHEGKKNPEYRKKRYACDLCDKMYSRRDTLFQHKRRHTQTQAQEPYPCAICQRIFYNKGCLRAHLMRHSDDRPYTCSECGHSFKRAGTLRKHMRIHTGEKPYSCSFCGKKFPYKYCLDTHMKSSRCKRSRAENKAA
ncbi:zinc finger protein 32-like isoform X1 [Tachysurus fulvidraco]|uniref:zinc finger protein 32-like isoform X1 n=1 Tax=Tachysurus fulvidraco TaxID=1234273 RepID=UPI001FEFFD14|nr:zinc finger protein 32-like isoform X1 [Tachysurus fulvidraco]XP_047667884.1 zinc finger protein 32-like isoform X1 [Tachysurus fulvidraco]XP_047667885.1 zinc finger protein 32-like isoform X1 [Tachysurus fulvidraco]XP_047667886.1 zinc finger protein 32-like isoform X1 [Tachysurus fulvidraco]XP_047667887.1 zinc finger protein 32-like isoform X1 [Tachysurus fulvidraco]XP_047667888.1 zinc finger protein 32-like isoform X1 [Tachysurus fulvidraco]XP_047667889.1 zinc finger protein 32-like isof